MRDKLILSSIVVGILLFAGTIYLSSNEEIVYSDEIKILKTWHLPYVLREVSGISHISKDRLACIQDEQGKIFIYNLNTASITDTIAFGPRGDYESIRIIDSTAYVLESSGKIVEIQHYASPQRRIRTYQTEFSSFNDMESFDYYPPTDEFLSIPKEDNLLNDKEQFIIYKLSSKQFKLKTKRFTSLDYKNSFFEVDPKSWLAEQGFFASELSVHPITKEVYILDARNSKLLILHPDGSPKKLYKLNPKTCQKPEGLSFDADGRLYISNEERSFAKQNIHMVEIQTNK